MLQGHFKARNTNHSKSWICTVRYSKVYLKVIQFSGDVDDIQSYESEDAEEFSKVEAYMQSKLCLLLYNRYLARQLKNATVLGVDPGASTETLFNRHKSTAYTLKNSILYPVQLFWALFERTMANNAQDRVSAFEIFTRSFSRGHPSQDTDSCV